jgi:uncharacterized protein involved in type VI secretion and phage assembly
MINGLVVGIVVDNVDPDKMNRVMVQFPVDSGDKVVSSWCRMCSPMGGNSRGMVMLPEKGTEVVLAYAYRSMSPYVLGAVYNGKDDTPEPYRNDDEKNDKRVFWSRNDHMVIFDDTSGAEKVELGAKASARLDVKSGPIYQSADAVEKTLTTYAEKHIIIEAKETISIKCKDFRLETDKTVAMEAGQKGAFKSGSATKIQSSSTQDYTASKVDINPPAPPGPPKAVKSTPSHRHPPMK